MLYHIALSSAVVCYPFRAIPYHSVTLYILLPYHSPLCYWVVVGRSQHILCHKLQEPPTNSKPRLQHSEDRL